MRDAAVKHFRCMKKQNGADQTCAIFLLEIGLKKGFSTASTFDVRGRRIDEAVKGTHKHSLWAAPLDGIFRAHGYRYEALDFHTRTLARPIVSSITDTPLGIESFFGPNTTSAIGQGRAAPVNGMSRCATGVL